MEFCLECSIEVLGKDFADFAGLITREQNNEGYGAKVTCTRCGEIFVDINGKRISSAEDTDELQHQHLTDKIDLREE